MTEPPSARRTEPIEQRLLTWERKLKTSARIMLMAAAAGICGGVAVADIVVPAANANVPGTSGLNTLTREATNARTYQFLIDANNLSGPGAISGLGYRLQNSAANATSWPAAAITWPSYEVIVSTSPNSASAMSTTFASNIGGDAVTVRSGPLTLLPNSFSGGAAAGVPNAFYTFIPFLTNFNYVGGTLSVTIRHTGNDAVAGDVRFLDAVTANAALGYAAQSTTTATGTTGAAAAFCVVNIVPAPASLALLGMGGLVATRRRRA